MSCQRQKGEGITAQAEGIDTEGGVDDPILTGQVQVMVNTRVDRTGEEGGEKRTTDSPNAEVVILGIYLRLSSFLV